MFEFFRRKINNDEIEVLHDIGILKSTPILPDSIIIICRKIRVLEYKIKELEVKCMLKEKEI